MLKIEASQERYIYFRYARVNEQDLNFFRHK